MASANPSNTKAMQFWNSGKTKEWLDLGIDLVIGKREGYYFWDMDGSKLMDVHINGGTYSLGHRNPEIIEALTEAVKSVDIGNHHFPSPLKALLAQTVINASPKGDYLSQVKKLCEENGALYIADEVQTGLLRSGKMWCIETYGVTPDIIVSSKGFSGGIYPISCVILNEKASRWMTQDGSAHMATFGGSELGCACALKVFEILGRDETKKNVEFVSKYLRNGLEQIKSDNPDTFVGIRQNGLIMGLEFAGASGAVAAMQHLYKNGVWAIYSQLDPSVLQFKPGVLVTKEYCDELLEKMAKGISEAKDDILSQL